MLPDQVLSTEALPGQFIFPRNAPVQPLVSYEYGGIALNDGTSGLRHQVWKGEYLEGAIVLSAPSVAPAAILTLEDVIAFQFTFDRNMNPFVTYELDGSDGAFYYWFDSTVPGFVTSELPDGSRTPRCAHDDNRDLQSTASDIILAYCRGTSLYFRAQRERYLTEHLLSAEIGASSLIQIGMNDVLRFQFQLSSIAPAPGDSP